MAMADDIDRYLVAEEDEVDVAARHERFETLDLRDADTALDMIDLRCSDGDWVRAHDITADSLYGWNLDVRRIQLNDSRFHRVNLRGLATRNPVRMERIHVAEDVLLYDADFPYANLSDGFVGGAVMVRGDRAGRLDLRGAAVGSLDTALGDLDDVYVSVDEDTYIHDVPDELADDLGYGRVTDREQQVLSAMDRYGDGPTDPVARDGLARYVEHMTDAAESDQEVNGLLSSLSRKGFVETVDEQVTYTRRGEHAMQDYDV